MCATGVDKLATHVALVLLYVYEHEGCQPACRDLNSRLHNTHACISPALALLSRGVALAPSVGCRRGVGDECAAASV